jgi:hypothetical protein
MIKSGLTLCVAKISKNVLNKNKKVVRSVEAMSLLTATDNLLQNRDRNQQPHRT